MPTLVRAPMDEAQRIWDSPDLRKHLMERFLHGTALGLTRSLAAQYAGVPFEAVLKWLARGEKEAKRREDGAPPDYSADTEEYYRLWLAYNQRVGQCALNALTVVETAMQGGSLDAAKWLLEKRFKYGAATRVNHRVAGRVEHEHTHTIEPLSDERLRDLLPRALQDMD